MNGAHEFLTALATVLCVAGVMSVVSQWLKQPAVLGYVLAGLVVGPHVPVPLVADRAIVQTLSELGVILLMFSLGLEFRVRRLAQLAPTAGLTALFECSAMFWLGFGAGELLGFSPRECIFSGALLAISSTTVVVRSFDELGVRAGLRERVVGVLIAEDFLAILMLALLPAAALSAALSWDELARSAGRLAALLALVFAIGLVVVPRAMRAVLRIGRTETTLVASLGICFAFALIVQSLGYSVALGAFVAGSLIAEAGDVRAVERLVHPVRDLFAAIFFVSVGMLLDPRLVAEHWDAVAVLAGTVVLGKIASVSLGVFLTGGGTRTAVESGMSLAQIGEFSFIIASIGIATGAAGEFLFPVAVAVSAITMVTTPWLMRLGPRAAALLDRKLPRRLQTFAALYGSWIEEVGDAARGDSLGAGLRRLGKLLALDAALLAAIAVSASIWQRELSGWLGEVLGASARIAGALVVVGACVLAAPFVLGILRVSQRIGVTLARSALPIIGSGQLDLSVAPRHALVMTLQLASVLLVGLPLLAVLQPFLPLGAGAVALALTLLGAAFGFWRSTADLQGHVRAGTSAVLEALIPQARGDSLSSKPGARDAVRELLPGLGEPEVMRLDSQSSACNRSLSELNLRGLTGATVLAISRDGVSITLPSASEVLRAGDLVALAGTREAVGAAKELLAEPRPGPTPPGLRAAT